MSRVNVGTLRRNRLRLDVKRWQHPSADDFWDGNWLVVDVTVEMGAWRGEFEGSLRADEFERFLADLRYLCDHLDSVAEFSTMEEWLLVRLKGDGRGHIYLEGEATDRPGTGNRLTFRTEFDQTYLPRLVAEVAAVVSEFPVRGDRPTSTR